MKDIITFCGKTITELKAEIKNRKKSENHSREQHISKSAKHNRFQSKLQRSLLKTTQAKKVQSSKIWTKANSTVFIKRQRVHPRRSNYRKKRLISYAAAVRKGNSKTNLFRKKSNTNIRISSDKSSSNENNEAPISQQIDLRQRLQEVKRKKYNIEIPQATKSTNETNYK